MHLLFLFSSFCALVPLVYLQPSPRVRQITECDRACKDIIHECLELASDQCKRTCAREILESEGSDNGTIGDWFDCYQECIMDAGIDCFIEGGKCLSACKDNVTHPQQQKQPQPQQQSPFQPPQQPSFQTPQQPQFQSPQPKAQDQRKMSELQGELNSQQTPRQQQIPSQSNPFKWGVPTEEKSTKINPQDRIPLHKSKEQSQQVDQQEENATSLYMNPYSSYATSPYSVAAVNPNARMYSSQWPSQTQQPYPQYNQQAYPQMQSPYAQNYQYPQAQGYTYRGIPSYPITTPYGQQAYPGYGNAYSAQRFPYGYQQGAYGRSPYGMNPYPAQANLRF